MSKTNHPLKDRWISEPLHLGNAIWSIIRLTFEFWTVLNASIRTILFYLYVKIYEVLITSVKILFLFYICTKFGQIKVICEITKIDIDICIQFHPSCWFESGFEASLVCATNPINISDWMLLEDPIGQKFDNPTDLSFDWSTIQLILQRS